MAGGLLGGFVGGIDAAAHHGNFWTGKGYTLKSTVSGLPKVNETIGPVEFSDESAYEFSDEYLPEPEGLRNFNANSTYDLGIGVAGETIYNVGFKMFGHNVLGSCTFDVFLSEIAFSSKEMLYLAMGHEYIHVQLNYNGYAYSAASKQEHIAYDWDIRQAKAWNLTKMANDEYKIMTSHFYDSPNWGWNSI